jgi:molybdate transport system substrate-binding protein
MKKTFATILWLPFFLWTFARAQTNAALSIAAASDLVYCLEELNTEFQKSHPATALRISTGSSGNFFAQIQNGAPFDIFLSADMKYPQELIKASLADSSSLTLYAIGYIVLWSMRSDIEVARGVEILRDEKIKKVAIANPAHAPYGRAAKAALEHFQLWETIQPKLVLGENIAQTAQFIQTGNVDAGIVALSLVLSPKLKNTGSYYLIPEASFPRLEQGAVLTKKGIKNPAAKRYLEFLRSQPARETFNRYGFRLPK